jgi:hypothetical protein
MLCVSYVMKVASGLPTMILLVVFLIPRLHTLWTFFTAVVCMGVAD